jgi:hypothetical protein
VIALDDLPEPHRDADPRPAPTMPAWWTAHRPRPRRLVVAGLVAATVVGLVVGSLVTDRHARQTQHARERSRVSAFVLPSGVDVHDEGQGRVVDLTLRIYNVGAGDLSIPEAPSGARVTTADPLVTIITGGNTVRPGEDALVRARVPIDCTSDRPVQVQIPVLSPDGTEHLLTPVADGQFGTDQPAQSLCNQNVYVEQLSIALSGSLARPTLSLANNSDDALTVSLDSGSPLTQDASQFLALTTRPALPTRVPPHKTVRLAVRIDVQGCHRNLQPLQDGGIGFLELNIEGGAEGPTQNGVDLSALVGAALERSCR